MQNYHLFSDGVQGTLTGDGCDAPAGGFGSKLEGVVSCCQFLRRREGSLQLHTGSGTGGVRRPRPALKTVAVTAPRVLN